MFDDFMLNTPFPTKLEYEIAKSRFLSSTILGDDLTGFIHINWWINPNHFIIIVVK